MSFLGKSSLTIVDVIVLCSSLISVWGSLVDIGSVSLSVMVVSSFVIGSLDIMMCSFCGSCSSGLCNVVIVRFETFSVSLGLLSVVVIEVYIILSVFGSSLDVTVVVIVVIVVVVVVVVVVLFGSSLTFSTSFLTTTSSSFLTSLSVLSTLTSSSLSFFDSINSSVI